MTAYPGRDFLLQVDTGSGFATVGGLRTTEMALNQTLVDTSHKDSGPWRKLLANSGLRRIAINAGGVFEDSAAEDLVRLAAFSGSALNSKLLFGNGDVLSGSFLVSSLERAGNHDGEETYRLVLESAGTITYTAGV